MVYQAVIQHPSELINAIKNISRTNEIEIYLTLCIYRPLEDQDITTNQDSDAHPLGVRLLEPLYHAWALALRDIDLPSKHARTLEANIILDLARPPLKIMNLMQYEARGLARIAALLRHKFRDVATLRTTIEGVPCWCVLHECEKHVAAVPRGLSWPTSRASHHVLDGREVRGRSRCLDLAREHWDDEHWSVLEGG